ncbi:MAG: cell division protein SepF [Thermoproteota archaeon]|nr:cell division protein SepF [Thermoproteota archaeon]
MTNLGKTAERIYHYIKKNEQAEKREAASAGLSTSPSKIYVKALPLRNLSDVDVVKHEVKAGNILILRVRPLAGKSVEDVKQAVNELCKFTQEVGGDIARLGEERVVITPSTVRIWRERSPAAKEKPAATS